MPCMTLLSMHGITYTCGLSACLRWCSITYVHTARKETSPIDAVLQKAARSEMMKRILRVRAQMVESMYKYFDADLSESHRAKLYIYTLLDPRFKNYKMWTTRKYVQNAQLCSECIWFCKTACQGFWMTDMLFVLQPKVRPGMGLAAVT